MNKTSLKICQALKKTLECSGLERIPPVRAAKNFFIQKVKSDFALVQGHKMYLDQGDSLCLSLDEYYEKLETGLIKRLVKPGNTVLDVGANIGYYTLIMARLVKRQGQVIAFEPDPANFAILKKNVEINGYNNIELVNQGVADRPGQSRLFLSESSNGEHAMFDCGQSNKYLDITTTSIDAHCQDRDRQIDFIKMDIQGAEAKALKGMTQTLKNNRNLKIITEFWPYGMRRVGGAAAEFIETLAEHGFDFSELDNTNKQVTRVSMDSLLKNYPADRKEYTNLLCTRRGGAC